LNNERGMKRFFILLAVGMEILYAQWNYAGYIHPSEMISTLTGKEIALPFRLSEFKFSYTKGDFDLKISTAIETRWSSGKTEADLREMYVIWYPSFGEVSVGKQILAWGAVDGNNPTDNLNAYNYYYMFLAGTDRKIGSLSIAVNYYAGDWKLTGVVIGEHRPNKLPFNEPDFPLELPPEPSHFLPVGAPLEYGLQAQITAGHRDISFSWFKGHDRSFALADPEKFTVGFRKTDILGVDIVRFLGDVTLRGESAYFLTGTDFNSPFQVKAEYGQYALQMEYTTLSDITLNAQLIGNQYFWFSGLTLDPALGPVPVTKHNFQMGTGTPFAVISDSGLLTSASGQLLDNRLELKGLLYKNLKDAGTMLGGEINYSPVENWTIHLALNQFIGDSSDPRNVFTTLEAFSHIRAGVEFNY